MARARSGSGSSVSGRAGLWGVAGLLAVVPGLAGWAVLIGVPSGASAGAQAPTAGAALFQEKGCSHCHGVDGKGTAKGPSLARIGRRMKRDQIEVQIRYGGNEMPPFGDALEAEELRQLVEYLHARRK